MITTNLHGACKAEAGQAINASWLTFRDDRGNSVTLFMSMVLAEHLAREFNRGMNGLGPTPTPLPEVSWSEPKTDTEIAMSRNELLDDLPVTFVPATREDLIKLAIARGISSPEDWADLMLLSRVLTAPDVTIIDDTPDTVDFDDGNITDEGEK